MYFSISGATVTHARRVTRWELMFAARGSPLEHPGSEKLSTTAIALFALAAVFVVVALIALGVVGGIIVRRHQHRHQHQHQAREGLPYSVPPAPQRKPQRIVSVSPGETVWCPPGSRSVLNDGTPRVDASGLRENPPSPSPPSPPPDLRTTAPWDLPAPRASAAAHKVRHSVTSADTWQSHWNPFVTPTLEGGHVRGWPLEEVPPLPLPLPPAVLVMGQVKNSHRPTLRIQTNIPAPRPRSQVHRRSRSAAKLAARNSAVVQ